MPKSQYVTLGVYVEAMRHTQSQLHLDEQTGSGQQGGRKQTQETQTQTSPQASLQSESVSSFTTVHVLHLPSDSNKHSDLIFTNGAKSRRLTTLYSIEEMLKH